MRPRVKTANRGSCGVSPFLMIESKPPFTTTSTRRRKIAVTITTPSMVLIMRGFDPRAQNLGWRKLGEESLSGHMEPDPPSFRIGRSPYVIKGQSKPTAHYVDSQTQVLEDQADGRDLFCD